MKYRSIILALLSGFFITALPGVAQEDAGIVNEKQRAAIEEARELMNRKLDTTTNVDKQQDEKKNRQPQEF